MATPEGAPQRWGALTWPELAEGRTRRRIAILPVGAVEEHGPHLPLETDNLLAEAVARRLAQAVDAYLLPTLPYGQVWSLRHFPGSLTVPAETLTRFVRDLTLDLGRQGMRLVVLLSGHLGNMAALKEAARQVHTLGGPATLFISYPEIRNAARGVATTPVSHPAIIHAEELETSMMLAERPEAVRMERAVREYPTYPPHFDVGTAGWDQVSRTGVFGDATAATREKGERLLEAVVATAAAMVRSALEGPDPQATAWAPSDGAGLGGRR